jgi:hypothetical protein
MMGGSMTQRVTQSALLFFGKRPSRCPAFAGGTKAGKRPPKNIPACHLPVIPSAQTLRKPHDFLFALSPQTASIRQRKQFRRSGRTSTRQPAPIFPNSLRRNELDAAFSEISKVGMRRKGDKNSIFISLRRNDLRRIAKNKT